MSQASSPIGQIEGRGPATIQQLQQHLTAAGITATNDLVAQAQERLANADPEVLWYFLVGSWAVLLHIGGTF
jgi:hypothetical protein